MPYIKSHDDPQALLACLKSNVYFFSFTRHLSSHTHSDIHRLLCRDHISRQWRERKPGGAVLQDIYILPLHRSWRYSGENRMKVLSERKHCILKFILYSVLAISYLLTYTLIWPESMIAGSPFSSLWFSKALWMLFIPVRRESDTFFWKVRITSRLLNTTQVRGKAFR